MSPADDKPAPSKIWKKRKATIHSGKQHDAAGTRKTTSTVLQENPSTAHMLKTRRIHSVLALQFAKNDKYMQSQATARAIVSTVVGLYNSS